MLDNVKKAMSVINRSAIRLRKQIAEVNEQIRALEKERAELMSTPVVRSDFVRAVCAAIDVMADNEQSAYSDYFFDQIKGKVAHGWGSPAAHNMIAMADGRVKLQGLFNRQRNYPDPDAAPLRAVIFLFRDAIKKALTESIEAFAWPIEGAKPLDEITARVEEIDREIERLLAERKELAAMAREIGIDVSDARLSAAQQSENTSSDD